ncbi:MAG: hypothetical protein V1773_03050 [bacterium]
MLNLDSIIAEYENCNVEGDLIKSYTTIKDEYLALKNGVGVKVCYLNNKLLLKGNDVFDYLNRISTNSVLNLKEFEHINTLFTNEKGRLIDRTTLLKLNGYNILVGGFLADKKLHTWIDRYIINEDITIDDVTDKIMIFELIGKQTESFLSLLIDDKFDTLNEKNILQCNVEGVEFLALRKNEVNGFKKYWILFGSNDLKMAYNFFMNNKSFFDLKFVGEDAYNIFRVENGIPATPNEISSRVNPHEIKILNDVSFTKGCYIGQEVIARLDTYDKVQRSLTGLLFENGANFEGITEELKLLNSEKKEVGFITSLVKSELYNKYAALGFIKKDYLELGSSYDVIVNNEIIAKAYITELPIKYENIYKNRG